MIDENAPRGENVLCASGAQRAAPVVRSALRSVAGCRSQAFFATISRKGTNTIVTPGFMSLVPFFAPRMGFIESTPVKKRRFVIRRHNPSGLRSLPTTHVGNPTQPAPNCCICLSWLIPIISLHAAVRPIPHYTILNQNKY